MFYYLRRSHMLLDIESSYMAPRVHHHNNLGNFRSIPSCPHILLELKKIHHVILFSFRAAHAHYRLTELLFLRASVSFGHVVGETEDSDSSNYRMSVNYGHPVTHA